MQPAPSLESRPFPQGVLRQCRYLHLDGPAWAKSTGLPALYLNLNAPVGSTSSYGTAGPKTCKLNDKLCLSCNHGWQAAQWAYRQATGNSWSSSTAANDQVIQGAVDYLGAGTTPNPGQNLAVGVYSTNAVYAKIAGAFHPTNGTGTLNYVPAPACQALPRSPPARGPSRTQARSTTVLP